MIFIWSPRSRCTKHFLNNWSTPANSSAPWRPPLIQLQLLRPAINRYSDAFPCLLDLLNITKLPVATENWSVFYTYVCSPIVLFESIEFDFYSERNIFICLNSINKNSTWLCKYCMASKTEIKKTIKDETHLFSFGMLQ